MLAIKLLSAGHAPEDVARRTGASRSSVFAWQARYRENGVAALQSRRIPGRPRTLPTAERQRLLTLLRGTPSDYGLAGTLWTQEHVRCLVNAHRRDPLGRTSIKRLLVELGILAEHPLERARARAPRVVKAWMEATLPGVRRWAGHSSAMAFVGRQWVASPTTASQTRPEMRWTCLYAFSKQRTLRFRIVPRRENASDVIAFIEALRGGPYDIVLIVDDPAVLKPKAVIAYLNLSGERARALVIPPSAALPGLARVGWKRARRTSLYR